MAAACNDSFDLREFYNENRLAKGEMTIAGTKLDLKKVRLPIYELATKEDHIAPARSVFIGSRLFGGPVDFVLAGSGHISGVVNLIYCSAPRTSSVPATTPPILPRRSTSSCAAPISLMTDRRTTGQAPPSSKRKCYSSLRGSYVVGSPRREKHVNRSHGTDRSSFLVLR